jgi:CO/xanthine dehydrogenase FAD-binding subunit
MIQAYYRPKSVEEALILLKQPNPKMVPLGGGTVLSRQQGDDMAVVDLCDTGLDQVSLEGSHAIIGAASKLQQVIEWDGACAALLQAVNLEATLHQRNLATIAGALVTADGRSPLATLLLAMDARLVWLPGEIEVPLGDWLLLRNQPWPGLLISKVTFFTQPKVTLEIVARSPADRPIVCAAVAAWPSGRTRIALGGFGAAPILAFDGPKADGAELAAESAFGHAEDAWASAEYRAKTAYTLVRRMINQE